MSTMISKFSRGSRAVAVAVAVTALVVGSGAGATAAADRAFPTSVTDTGWDFTADRLGLRDQLVVSVSGGDTGWD